MNDETHKKVTLACPHMGNVPVFDKDFYGDAFLSDPFSNYKEMRDLGPVVWLSQQGNYAVTQYKEAKEVLRNHEVFSSASGVAGDDFGCDFLKGNTLASDPPLHGKLRTAMAAPLLPGALNEVRPRIEKSAYGLIDRLIHQGEFEGVSELARFLPETVVTDLIGLPEDGRDNMLSWADASFNIIGTQNARGRQGVETIKEMREWITTKAIPGRLKPESWTARIYELVDSGDIEDWMAPLLIRDYINPSLDTTISATSMLLFQLGKNPGQWKLLQENPDYISNAVNEAVRLSTPIRTFSRTITQKYELGGVTLAPGLRMMVLFASANRDERKFSDPDKFDVTRFGIEHLGFGHGIHMCVGMHLARLEMEALLKAMIESVDQIIVGEPELAVNNIIYGFKTLPITLTPLVTRPRQAEKIVPRQVEEAYWIHAMVSKRSDVADGIIALELQSSVETPLPSFSAGAHVDIEIQSGIVRQYSLSNDPALGNSESSFYRLGILRDDNGRGGSIGVHEKIFKGSKVRISRPKNKFKLNETAHHSVLFAGGIGITPILAMSYALEDQKKSFSVHYSGRAKSKMAFEDEILAQPFRDNYKFYYDDDPQTDFNATRILGKVDSSTHIYVCGPAGYMEYILDEARRAGFSEEQLHYEYFGAEIDIEGDAFEIIGARSGHSFKVPVGSTILQVMEAQGIPVNKSCESGVCGSCITKVIEGTPDHRDFVLTPEEKASGEKIAICCSRSRSSKLVLDI